MNKKAFIGILMALIVPAIIFFFIDSLPKAALPQPLYADSVQTVVKKGKKVNETVWEQLPDFTLTNQMGKQVSFSDFSLSDSGKITVIDFFFTRCPTICPGMTRKMKWLQGVVQKGVKVGDNSADYVQYLSISIDPERDSVESLKKWADRFQIDPGNWWLLTGDKKTIYDLSLKYMKLQAQDPSVDSSFPHTDIFTLVDKHGVIRARRDKHGNPLLYHSDDEKAMNNLAEDIVLLSLEKNKKAKGPFTGKFMLITVVFVAAVAGIILLMYFLKKNKR